jgi:Flp pilus assembly protein TadB
MTTLTLLSLVAGATAGTGAFCLVLAVVGVPARDRSRPPLLVRARRHGRRGTARLLWGLVVGLVTLIATRWPVAAVAAGLLTTFWDRIAGGGAEERHSIERLDAMAVWTESLRDTIAGAIGLEQAIPATATTAARVLRPSLNLLVDRLRIREPLPTALLRFAGDVDDASADVVCAALVLNARLRGPGLRDVLTALAASTREELDLRRRIEASRRSIRRSVKIVLGIVLSVMGLLAVLNRQYVQPYEGPAGQLALLVVVGLFMAGLLWLRRLATPSRTERFFVRVEEDAAGTVPAGRPAGTSSQVESRDPAQGLTS